jgi:hypothetical protein
MYHLIAVFCLHLFLNPFSEGECTLPTLLTAGSLTFKEIIIFFTEGLSLIFPGE